MKQFSVSLDVVTPGEVMPTFFEGLGIDSANFSSRRLREGMLWRLESDLSEDEDASIQEQVDSIFALVAPDKIRGNGIRAYISIAVYYDTATCSVEIPPTCISMLQGSGIAIEVTCYPISEEEKGRSTTRAH